MYAVIARSEPVPTPNCSFIAETPKFCSAPSAAACSAKKREAHHHRQASSTRASSAGRASLLRHAPRTQQRRVDANEQQHDKGEPARRAARVPAVGVADRGAEHRRQRKAEHAATLWLLKAWPRRRGEILP